MVRDRSKAAVDKRNRRTSLDRVSFNNFSRLKFFKGQVWILLKKPQMDQEKSAKKESSFCSTNGWLKILNLKSDNAEHVLSVPLPAYQTFVSCHPKRTILTNNLCAIMTLLSLVTIILILFSKMKILLVKKDQLARHIKIKARIIANDISGTLIS